MIDPSFEGRRAFILENTRLQTPPHTPELELHLADEITPIWKMTEEALAEMTPFSLGTDGGGSLRIPASTTPRSSPASG